MKTFNIRRYLSTLATALTLSAASFGAQTPGQGRLFQPSPA